MNFPSKHMPAIYLPVCLGTISQSTAHVEAGKSIIVNVEMDPENPISIVDRGGDKKKKNSGTDDFNRGTVEAIT